MKSVADIFGCSKQTVHSWVNRFLKNNTLSRTSGSGRRRILSNEVIKKVILKIKRNRLITAREIQEDLGLENVSVRTIQRMISKYTHFKSFWTVRKPLISESNRKKRVRWCKEHLHWTIEDWKKVLWSDECVIPLRRFGRFRYWKKWNEIFDGRLYTPTVTRDKSVLIWGSFCYNGTGNLEPIEGQITSKSFVRMLRCHLKAIAARLFDGDDWIFQHDNARPHSAEHTEQFLRSEDVKILPWPAQSPDLNPIENLWAILKKGVRRRRVRNIHGLLIAIADEWNNLKDSTLSALVESMPRRCELVIAKKGHPTKY